MKLTSAHWQAGSAPPSFAWCNKLPRSQNRKYGTLFIVRHSGTLRIKFTFQLYYYCQLSAWLRNNLNWLRVRAQYASMLRLTFRSWLLICSLLSGRQLFVQLQVNASRLWKVNDICSNFRHFHLSCYDSYYLTYMCFFKFHLSCILFIVGTLLTLTSKEPLLIF